MHKFQREFLRYSRRQMFNRIQTTTGAIAVGFVFLSLIYNRTSVSHSPKYSSSSSSPKDLFHYSNELNELRHEILELKLKVFHLEQTLSSSSSLKSFVRWIHELFTHVSSISSSFLLYTFFLYLFHVCVFQSSTTQTIKLLHIINIISYSMITIFYTSLKHFHYSNLAWLLFVLLFIRLYVH